MFQRAMVLVINNVNGCLISKQHIFTRIALTQDMPKLFNSQTILVVALSVLVFTCILPIYESRRVSSLSDNTTSNSGSGSAAATENLSLALLTDALFSDAGWGAFGYNAAQALHTKYGYEVDFKDNVSIPRIESTLREYADLGYDLIIAQGYEWGKPAVRVGVDYPNTKFVVFTGLSNSSNVASIYPMQQEATYLLGSLAAMLTRTGTVGFIGGERYPNVINIFKGYEQGAKDVNPDINVLSTYLDNWDNPASGKSAALTQISSGADLLLHVADTSGHGVIEAAKERGVYAFGAVSDQNKLAPSTVLTSFVIDVEKAFDQVVRMVQENRFEGEIQKPGLEPYKGSPGGGIVYIAPFYELEEKVPQGVKQKFVQMKEQILEGQIKIPERYQENANTTTTTTSAIASTIYQ